MAITINQVYPWGRNHDEYRRMFALTDGDLDRRILCCADGPASFNAEMARRGRRVISCDPLYRFPAKEIHRRVRGTRRHMLNLVRDHCERFVWDTIASPEALAELRHTAMQEFLGDYEAGRRQGRYVTAALPDLPFPSSTFDLVLCSHFLFLYSDEFPLGFHIDSIREMARVGREVRMFPLLNHAGRPSQHLEPTIETLRSGGLDARMVDVPYEFQRGGNRMLAVTRTIAEPAG